MIRHPDLLSLVVLGLAAFRLARLAGWDEITVGLRTWVTGISDAHYNQTARFIESVKETGGDPWDPETPHGAELARALPERRYYLAKLIRCPWCFGFWASVALWLVWSVEPRVTIWASIPFAVSAIVGLVAKNMDP